MYNIMLKAKKNDLVCFYHQQPLLKYQLTKMLVLYCYVYYPIINL